MVIIADLETDGFTPSEIFVVGVLDYETDDYRSYTGDDIPDGLQRIAEADVVIGHNFKTYDAQVIKNLTEGLIVIPKQKIIDTLEMSKSLFPKLKTHKLEEWGEILGLPKIYWKKFDKYYPEMEGYCERDCRLNKVLYDFLVSQMPED